MNLTKTFASSADIVKDIIQELNDTLKPMGYTLRYRTGSGYELIDSNYKIMFDKKPFAYLEEALMKFLET